MAIGIDGRGFPETFAKQTKGGLHGPPFTFCYQADKDSHAERVSVCTLLQPPRSGLRRAQSAEPFLAIFRALGCPARSGRIHDVFDRARLAK